MMQVSSGSLLQPGRDMSWLLFSWANLSSISIVLTMWAQTCIILQNEFDVLDLVIGSVQLKVFPDRWTKTQILQKRKTCLPLTPVLMIVSRPLDKSLINLSTESRPASTSMMSALGLVYLFESTELMKAVRFCSCQSTKSRSRGELWPLTSRAFSSAGDFPDEVSATARWKNALVCD